MELNKRNKINYAFWLYPKTLSLLPVSLKERKWANRLPSSRKREYLYSRGYLRKSLASIFNIEYLKIPLEAPPGKPPLLKNGLGYISISHCNDALLLGWSTRKIGLDIESLNRSINSKLISSKFFSEYEKSLIKDLNSEELKNKFLSIWVLKEAAIKWQKGNIYKDFKDWEIVKDKALNIKLNTKIDAYLLNYKLWKIGIVFENHLKNFSPVICTN